MKTSSLLAAVSAIAIGLAAPAGAVTLESVSGIWQNAQAGGSTTGEGTSRIEFGDRIPDQPARSSYVFDGVAPPAFDITPDTIFKIGDFTHNNFPIWDPVLTSADLLLDLNFGDGQTVSSTFKFTHDETYNDPNPCAYGGANGQGANVNGCADRVMFESLGDASTPITIDGQDYRLTLNGFMVDGEIVNSFLTTEDASNTAGLFAHLEQIAPVPLPASGLLLLGGLGAVAAARRKRAA